MIVYTRGRIRQLRSGLPRDRRRRVHRHSDRAARESRQRQRVRRSSPARCRITIAPTSSARRRSARRWSSRFIRISGAAGLALTTAHYYTPSGRLIQRPWDATFDEYLSYGLKDQDRGRGRTAPNELKHTDAGRPVYSGGGIEPDKRIAGPVEGFNPTRFGRTLYARQQFEHFAQSYAAEGDTRDQRRVRPAANS